MKKKYDYEKIEKWASDGFSSADKNVRYENSAARRIYDGEEKPSKRSFFSFFRSPGIQIAGAFMAAVVVGATTFGALKYLEYRGSYTAPGPGAHGDAVAQAGQENDGVGSRNEYTEETVHDEPARDISETADVYDRESEAEGIQTDKNLYVDPADPVVIVVSGDNAYPAFTCRRSIYDLIDYIAPGIPYVPGDKLQIVSNIDGPMEIHEFHVKSRYSSLSTEQVGFDQFYDFVNKAGSEYKTFSVTMVVSWGAPFNDDYYVEFYIYNPDKQQTEQSGEDEKTEDTKTEITETDPGTEEITAEETIEETTGETTDDTTEEKTGETAEIDRIKAEFDAYLGSKLREGMTKKDVLISFKDVRGPAGTVSERFIAAADITDRTDGADGFMAIRDDGYDLICMYDAESLTVSEVRVVVRSGGDIPDLPFGIDVGDLPETILGKMGLPVTNDSQTLDGLPDKIFSDGDLKFNYSSGSLVLTYTYRYENMAAYLGIEATQSYFEIYVEMQ